MSPNNSTMADGIAIKVILKPILGLMDANDPQLSKLEIEKTITRNPRTLVKDLCKSVMEEYNLGNVGDDDFQVFVRHPNLEYNPFRTFFHDMNSPIGSVALLLEDTLTIKILISLKFCECIKMVKVDEVYEGSSFIIRTPYFYGSNLYFFYTF
uniref:DEK_C domain-containing protein n=1 Tax=Strongyloides papillosus TaxID=174720 RepID=A0A0N5CHN4_STREA